MCNDFKVILKIENLDKELKNVTEQNLKEIIVNLNPICLITYFLKITPNILKAKRRKS